MKDLMAAATSEVTTQKYLKHLPICHSEFDALDQWIRGSRMYLYSVLLCRGAPLWMIQTAEREATLRTHRVVHQVQKSPQCTW